MGDVSDIYPSLMSSCNCLLISSQFRATIMHRGLCVLVLDFRVGRADLWNDFLFFSCFRLWKKMLTTFPLTFPEKAVITMQKLWFCFCSTAKFLFSSYDLMNWLFLYNASSLFLPSNLSQWYNVFSLAELCSCRSSQTNVLHISHFASKRKSCN